MAKGTRGRRRITSRQCRPTPYPLPSVNQSGDPNQKKCSKKFKRDWEDATCSVCMEYPHNAVLLLCSSHDKGCRPYMCGTSYRYSNCLEQYKKAYTKVKLLNQSQSLQSAINSPAPAPAPFSDWAAEKGEITELACPLCRGQVKGWTVVEPARAYLNAKKRSCMQDECSFVGNFKEMRKHVKTEHPSARPREMDPLLEQKWRRLEGERERDDVISTIRSSMPGAVVFGDYVIEGSPFGFGSEDDEDGFEVDVMDRNEGFGVGIDGNLINVLRFLQAFGSAGNIGSNRGSRRPGGSRDPTHASGGGTAGLERNLPGFDYSDVDSDGIGGNVVHENSTSLVGRLRRHGRVLLGRSGRRRRRTEDPGGRG